MPHCHLCLALFLCQATVRASARRRPWLCPALPIPKQFTCSRLPTPPHRCSHHLYFVKCASIPSNNTSRQSVTTDSTWLLAPLLPALCVNNSRW